MNIEEIKLAIQNGNTVHWGNDGYTVKYNEKQDNYYIEYSNGNIVGLTHQDGKTLNGEEDEFYVNVKPLSIKSVKELFRSICTDTWGDAMEAWFETAGQMYVRGLVIPTEWQYSSGISPTETDSYWHPIFQEANDDSLKTIGYFLFRYCQYLKFKEINY